MMRNRKCMVRDRIGMLRNNNSALVAVCLVFFMAAAMPAAYCPAAQADRSGNEAVAKVNGVEITASALEARVARILKAKGHGGAGVGQEDFRAIARKALDKLIVQELAYQKARAEGMKVKPEELDAAIAALKRRAGGEKKYREMLQRNNVTEERLRAELERNRLVKKIFQKEVLSRVVLTEEDIKREYERTKSDFVIPEKILVDDVVVFMDPADKDALKAAEALRKRITDDKEKDPRHIPSDGTFIVREMELHKNKQKELYEAAVKLKEGGVSDVIITTDSLHIVKLKKYSPGRDADYKQVRGFVESRLRAREAGKIMEKWEKNLKEGARIEIFDAEGKVKEQE